MASPSPPTAGSGWLRWCPPPLPVSTVPPPPDLSRHAARSAQRLLCSPRWTPLRLEFRPAAAGLRRCSGWPSLGTSYLLPPPPHYGAPSHPRLQNPSRDPTNLVAPGLPGYRCRLGLCHGTPCPCWSPRRLQDNSVAATPGDYDLLLGRPHALISTPVGQCCSSNAGDTSTATMS
jgi:hypothetical protein